MRTDGPGENPEVEYKIDEGRTYNSIEVYEEWHKNTISKKSLDSSEMTPTKVHGKSNEFNKKTPLVGPSHENISSSTLGAAFKRMTFVLRSSHELEIILKKVETLFISFLKDHMGRGPPPNIAKNTCLFNRWLIGRTSLNSPIVAFPWPSEDKIKFAKTYWKAGHALTLFLFEMLVYFGVLTKNKRFDEQFIYAIGYLDPDALHTRLIKQHMMFQESKLIDIIVHGKHTHPLQLVIILIAAEMEIFHLPFHPYNLVPSLVSYEDNRGRSAWNLCLEAPTVFFNNAMMLNENIAPPVIRTYWSNHILKWLPSPLDKDDIVQFIGYARTLLSHDVTAKKAWDEKYKPTAQGGLYFKTVRDSDFQKFEASIINNASMRQNKISSIIAGPKKLNLLRGG